MITNNDRQLIANFSNGTFQGIFELNPEFTLDVWDKSGATAAVAKTSGKSGNKTFGPWGI